jgi:hypothetical protein
VILTGGLDLSVSVARLNSAEGNIGETLALPAIRSRADRGRRCSVARRPYLAPSSVRSS